MRFGRLHAGRLALATQEHLDRVMSYIDPAGKEGATAGTGGTRCGDHGFFVTPTLLEATTPDMRVVREEIFGPVAALTSFAAMNAVQHYRLVRRRYSRSPADRHPGLIPRR